MAEANKVNPLAFLAALEIGDAVEVGHRKYQHRVTRVRRLTDRLIWTGGDYGPALWWRENGESAEPYPEGWRLVGLADENLIRREIVDRMEMVNWKGLSTRDLKAIASVLDERD